MEQQIRKQNNCTVAQLALLAIDDSLLAIKKSVKNTLVDTDTADAIVAHLIELKWAVVNAQEEIDKIVRIS